MNAEKIKQKKHRQKERKKIFRKWHRRMGIISALFFLNLAITGILLNHYQALNLHQNYITNEWLLDWYNVESPSQIDCISTSQKKSRHPLICQVANLTFVSQAAEQAALLFRDKGELISATQNQSEVYLLTTEQLFVYTADFNLIESIALKEFNFPRDLTAKINGMKFQNQRLEITTTEKNFYLNIDLLEVTPIQPDENIELEKNILSNSHLASELSDYSLKPILLSQYRKHQITQLKLLQDLHSGQLLSTSGKLVTDLVGIVVILLIFSGLITWQRRKNSALES